MAAAKARPPPCRSIVSLLRENGFSFATVGSLLQEGVPEVAAECYETRPGDNRRYDRLFGEGTE